MIISASRRTDIPAFHADWFIKVVRQGYCDIPLPFRPTQVRRISLTPQDVDVIVFWTRYPRPLLRYLDELDQYGYRYYFQYTLMNNPRQFDCRGPALEVTLDTFRLLSARLGAERVIWRYDPIVFSNLTPPEFHRQTYARLAEQLRGYTHRSVISILDIYRKLHKRFDHLAQAGVEIYPVLPGGDIDSQFPTLHFAELMYSLTQIAAENNMTLTSCAEEIDLTPYGIHPGKCIDDELIRSAFGRQVSPAKDPHQRPACGCVSSIDIGSYDTCRFGCVYCYATG